MFDQHIFHYELSIKQSKSLTDASYDLEDWQNVFAKVIEMYEMRTEWVGNEEIHTLDGKTGTLTRMMQHPINGWYSSTPERYEVVFDNGVKFKAI